MCTHTHTPQHTQPLKWLFTRFTWITGVMILQARGPPALTPNQQSAKALKAKCTTDSLITSYYFARERGCKVL